MIGGEVAEIFKDDICEDVDITIGQIRLIERMQLDGT
jgi:hypothetical protein